MIVFLPHDSLSAKQNIQNFIVVWSLISDCSKETSVFSAVEDEDAGLYWRHKGELPSETSVNCTANPYKQPQDQEVDKWSESSWLSEAMLGWKK